MDYFVFPRNCAITLPPFAVGSPFWDNWFVYTMWRKGIPIIDATKTITAVHQNHDYAHVLHGKDHRYKGPEAKLNKSLLDDRIAKEFSCLDSTHILTSKGVKKVYTLKHIRRKWDRFTQMHSGIKFLRKVKDYIVSKLNKLF
jgi:hypothetical protein